MILKRIFVPTISLLLLGCTNQVSLKQLKSGDLIFCSYNIGELNEAIANVTKTNQNKNYSHMGIVEVKNNMIWIIHASIKRGVVKESIDSFIRNEQAKTIDIYRLKNKYERYIQKALSVAKNKIGYPYNHSYLINDSSYYCSQLIYDIYKEGHIFNLSPMTFKNSHTGEYNAKWVNYYQRLNCEIPEDKPGCNPNGMAISKKLIFLGSLRQDLSY